MPTLKGQEILDIPAGTQHGEIFKIKGRGLPDVRSHKNGDEVVQVMIEIPKKLSDRQKELLREFAETEDSEVMPQKKSFWDKFERSGDRRLIRLPIGREQDDASTLKQKVTGFKNECR